MDPADHCQWIAKFVPQLKIPCSNGTLVMMDLGFRKGYQLFLKKDYIQEHEQVIVYICHTEITTDNQILRMQDRSSMVLHHRILAMVPDTAMEMPPCSVLILMIGIKTARVLLAMLRITNHSRVLTKWGYSSVILASTSLGLLYRVLRHQIHPTLSVRPVGN